jgi:hypothetical protein
VLAARMAAEDFGGNMFGRPIEVIDADHQNKADLASAIARGWFDRQGVTAIADLTNSAVALAVQQLARERGKITLLTGPATTKLTNEECSPTGFHWAFDTYSQATGTAKAMLAEGGKTWFLLVADYAFGHQLAHDLRAVISAGGGKVVGEAVAPAVHTRFRELPVAGAGFQRMSRYLPAPAEWPDSSLLSAPLSAVAPAHFFDFNMVARPLDSNLNMRLHSLGPSRLRPAGESRSPP